MGSEQTTISAIDHARKQTILLLILADVLLVGLTILKGQPTIWSDFEREGNLWTLGNSIQTSLVAFLAYVNYLLVSGWGPGRCLRLSWPWAALAIVFVILAMDDMLLLHERGGHAIEDAMPMLSRSNITLYMDDMIELAYVLGGGIFGFAVLRKRMQRRRCFGYYLLGVASFLAATAIGLNPAVKSIPFPLAVIQVLQLVAASFFFVSFLNFMSAEIVLAGSLSANEVQHDERPAAGLTGKTAAASSSLT